MRGVFYTSPFYVIGIWVLYTIGVGVYTCMGGCLYTVITCVSLFIDVFLIVWNIVMGIVYSIGVGTSTCIGGCLCGITCMCI
jgi:hypothetical protein